MNRDSDLRYMLQAVDAADAVRGSTAPNPWVGCVIVTDDGTTFEGATEPPPGPHAEVIALRAAAGSAIGATLYTTLEPCSHHGRTGPCAQAVIDAGVARVVVAVGDPDPKVSGGGVAALRSAGIEVEVGVGADVVADQLGPYIHHRRTGRPFVTLKMATSLDGRTAAPDKSSQWITGPEARTDVHRLRARCDGVLVGAGTIRDDDPSLDVRHVAGVDPRRIVLGTAPISAKVHPCIEVGGPLGDVLDELGDAGIVDLLVEGGASVARSFHEAGLVDCYVVYMAPVLFGGDDGRPLFAGPGAATIDDVWRGRLVDVARLGGDVRLTVEPR
ncbi:MAG: bifunctional diaminohydroxyphosphoribosylaminopyrimidine deaminase/5-amino-6-(5-phosphoribosylamino)uracil reductase RibD [Actinomycetia bacterium]|nr:bifunctional diaminohydroxyphosphoribosylaminopyrimidine deaminase/5-amino-6-(5-phosphoribosylamino)uracil reductase RibD [Actinomycetes bacterium]MCP4958920.1 bifunctional diaminohydroxyphosphoribosylaminopyrimidine deaminase/5-amino-6-(5-phosphoribosylamino)uracil reductase RibD [Actinomycetes bacterium]